MAIIGGAGNPVGGSFTGPAEALEVVGTRTETFGYAYSGTFEATTSEQTALDFTSGNYLFVGQLQVNAFLQLNNVTIRQVGANVTFNGVTVALLQAPLEDAVSSITQDLIIPPYTEVKVTVISATGDSDNFATVGLTGKIFRTRD